MPEKTSAMFIVREKKENIEVQSTLSFIIKQNLMLAILRANKHINLSETYSILVAPRCWDNFAK